MTYLAWFFLTLFVQWFLIIFFPERCSRGRILTRPLARIIRLPGPWVRGFQILSCAGIYEVLSDTNIISNNQGSIFYFLSIIVLYLDDYLTGDDDKWKKFWEGAKNKIKWKMELPVPQEE